MDAAGQPPWLETRRFKLRVCGRNLKFNSHEWLFVWIIRVEAEKHSGGVWTIRTRLDGLMRQVGIVGML